MMHQKDVLYKRMMEDPKIANCERLPVCDDGGNDTFGRSKELEEFIAFRGTKRVKVSETKSAIAIAPSIDVESQQ